MSRRLDWSLALLCLAATGVFLAFTYLGTWSLDLSAFYYAARLYGFGAYAEIYQSAPNFFVQTPSPTVAQMMLEQGHESEMVVPYLYPPLWSAIFAPIAVRLPPQPFFDAILIAQILMTLVAVLLAHRAIRPALPVSAWVGISCAALVLTYPSLLAFGLNQLQIMVTFLLILAFERDRAGAQYAAGAALGVAAALKVMPILFVLVFLAGRRWTAAGVSVAVAAGLALLSLLLAGPDLHVAFLDQIERLNAITAVADVNLGLSAVLSQIARADVFLADGGVATRFAVVDAIGWVKTVSRVSFVVLVAALYLATVRLADPFWPQLFGLSVLVVLCGPMGWAHYLMLSFLLLPGIFTLVRRAWAMLFILCTLGLFSSVLLSVILSQGQFGFLLGRLGTGWMIVAVLVVLGGAWFQQRTPNTRGDR